MTATWLTRPVISEITLALFEDSGYITLYNDNWMCVCVCIYHVDGIKSIITMLVCLTGVKGWDVNLLQIAVKRQP
jgi:hypothetical protein